MGRIVGEVPTREGDIVVMVVLVLRTACDWHWWMKREVREQGKKTRTPLMLCTTGMSKKRKRTGQGTRRQQE